MWITFYGAQPKPGIKYHCMPQEDFEKLVEIKERAFEAICTGDQEAESKAITLIEDFDKPVTEQIYGNSTCIICKKTIMGLPSKHKCNPTYQALKASHTKLVETLRGFRDAPQFMHVPNWVVIKSEKALEKAEAL